MNKSILISIRPEHVVKILNGKKTLELRKSVPKDFVGWVYLYCTKDRKYWKGFVNSGNLEYAPKHAEMYGKVVARFWFDEYTTYHFDEYLGGYLDETKEIMLHEDKEELNKLCSNYIEIERYGRYKGSPYVYVYGENLYAWHIKQLETFNMPKELSDFYIFREEWVYCGRDCPPYVDEVRYKLRKIYRDWQYVYIEKI